MTRSTVIASSLLALYPGVSSSAGITTFFGDKQGRDARQARLHVSVRSVNLPTLCASVFNLSAPYAGFITPSRAARRLAAAMPDWSAPSM